MTPKHRIDSLLLLGLAAGAVLAAVGLTRDADFRTTIDAGAAAVVNGRRVARVRYDQAITLLERDLGRPVTDEERRRALDRLIDEELLLQKAQELELPQTDRKLRGDIVAAMLDTIASQASAAEPGDDELRRFYEENRPLLQGGAQLRIGAVFVSTSARDNARERAELVASRLRAGEPLASVRGELGDPAGLEPPSSAVPAARVAEYVGPTAAARLASMAVGEVSDPIGASDGFRVVTLLERSVPDGGFESMRELALAQYHRRAVENEVRRYLDSLRRGAEIRETETNAAGTP